MRWWFSRELYVKILIGIILGVIIGLTMGNALDVVLNPIGEVFLRLLKMLIAPVIFFTIVSGITTMDSVKSLRSIGGKLLLYYLSTSVLAVIIGLGIGWIIQPGNQGMTFSEADKPTEEIAKFNFIDSLVSYVPTNPFQALVEGNVLQILFFSIFFGIVLLLLGDKVKTLTAVMRQGADATIKITDIVMKFSPYGILALVVQMVNSLSISTLAEVGKFIIADYIALIIVLLIVYPLQLKFLAKIKTLPFFKAISPAIMIAASTTSSAATLPVNLRVADKNLKIPEKIYGFGLTIGATVNTNGMAVAIGVIAIFACNIYGVPLTLPLLFQFVFLGLLLSAGAAGVKGAGIVLSATLLSTMGLPLELIPILAAIWPLIDIGHTTVNVVGDLVGVSVIAARDDEMDVEAFNNPVLVTNNDMHQGKF
ncbi:dicarboxylate/amino acid:cation symporter [Bacillus sp. EB01]|uniref:dicarboxylate/amino acid:cation symporter n=1 Tax=Bacillus sp. EB01 TaxID=1347086 RepID=UPI0005C55FF8|nr:dicarboxylate/amino acid:cation symporter [Bacillus sp. EB01]